MINEIQSNYGEMTTPSHEKSIMVSYINKKIKYFLFPGDSLLTICSNVIEFASDSTQLHKIFRVDDEVRVSTIVRMKDMYALNSISEIEYGEMYYYMRDQELFEEEKNSPPENKKEQAHLKDSLKKCRYKIFAQ